MTSCERLWQVDALRQEQLSANDADSFARHRETCQVCSQRLLDDDELAALGRAIPLRKVDAFHERRLRQAILRRAATSEEASYHRRLRASKWAATLFVVALFTLTCAAFRAHVRRVPSAPAESPARLFGATIDARPGAVWATRTEGATERVILSDGILTLAVRHREPGERFIVDLPDGVLEVHGTRFTIEVAAETTRSVHVIEGLVALRRSGSAEVLLATGESWPPVDPSVPLTPPRIDAHPASARPPKARPIARKPPAPPLAESPVRDTSDYEIAVERFAAQDYEEAARALHRYAIAHPDRAEAEDAAFLEASALAHVGRFDAASVVAEGFLDRYPHSLHAADAATLAIHEARDRDCPRARVLALRWISDLASRRVALGRCSEP